MTQWIAPQQKITWTGDLAVGQKVTITYSVTVTGDGDTHLLKGTSGRTALQQLANGDVVHG